MPVINNSAVTNDKATCFMYLREITGTTIKSAPIVGRNTARVNSPKKFEFSNFYPFLNNSNKI